VEKECPELWRTRPSYIDRVGRNGKVKSFDSPRGEGRCCLLHLGGPEAEIHRDSGFFWRGGGLTMTADAGEMDESAGCTPKVPGGSVVVWYPRWGG
jgi:hypothetical protein